MHLPIDTSSGIPIFRQIVNAILRLIASGHLKPEERIPSVRELCAKLRLNPATVNKAYQELEVEGWLETRRGLGTFVASQLPKVTRADARELLAPRIDELLVEAARLGLSPADLAELIRRKSGDLPKSAHRRDNVPRD